MQYKWIAIIVTTIGTLMVSIDLRILVVGLPVIAKQMHTSADELIWITQAYLLSCTVCLLLVGRIADIFGRVKLFNLGFVVFTVGSAFCALANSSSELIGFRVIQGIGYAIILTNSVTIITDSSPKKELGMMLSIHGIAWRVGSVAGLTLSGVILSVVNWRGLFYVNVPIGIFGTLWAYSRLREISTKDTTKEMDWLGFGLFSLGLALVLLAITYFSYGLSGFTYGFILLVTGLVLVTLFVRLESLTHSPLLDLHLFRIPLFAAGNFALLLNALVFNGAAILIALYLEVGLGYTPLAAGLGILPMDAFLLTSSLISGVLSDKYGSRWLATFGLLLIAIGMFLISTFGINTRYMQIALGLSLIGVGNGMFSSPNTRAIMISVPANRRGIANGFRSTMYNVGSTISYGLVMLFITFGVPYNSLSSLLQGTVSDPNTILLDRMEFLAGFRIAALLLAIICIAAMVPSAMKGSREIESLV